MSMKIQEIQNLTTPLEAPIAARHCASFLCQLRGLMFRRALGQNEGLLLAQKRETRSEAAIHMLFMFVDLAVVWINAKHEVVDVRYAKRWRPAYVPKNPAQYILELPIHYFDQFQIGDQLAFYEKNLD